MATPKIFKAAVGDTVAELQVGKVTVQMHRSRLEGIAAHIESYTLGNGKGYRKVGDDSFHVEMDWSGITLYPRGLHPWASTAPKGDTIRIEYRDVSPTRIIQTIG